MNGSGLSEDFKDLILKFFAYNGEERPTMEQLKNHPWMQSSTFNFEATRNDLLNQLAFKQQSKTEQASVEQMTKPVKVKRGTVMVWID